MQGKGERRAATSLMSSGPVRLLLMLMAISASGFGFDAASREPGPSHVLVEPPSTDVDHDSVRPLPFFHDLYTFRSEGDHTTVVATYAVETGQLLRKRVGDNNRYRFSVSLLLVDSVLLSVTNRHDSLFVDLPRHLRNEHLLYTHIEVQAPPSRSIRLGVYMTDAMDAGIGQTYWEYTRIPDYSGTELMVSDVALGQPDAEIGWHRRGATLALLPTGQLPSRAFDVYYEIYNLPAGNFYTTEITVERMAGNSSKTAEDQEPIRLSFSGESTAATDGTLPQLRRVGTSFPRGSYRITVTIEDLTTGKTASQSRTFHVRSSGPGATMVPGRQVAPSIR